MLQGLESRLSKLQATATEERHFERPTGDEVAAADQALRNLGSAAAFELEQVRAAAAVVEKVLLLLLGCGCGSGRGGCWCGCWCGC